MLSAWGEGEGLDLQIGRIVVCGKIISNGVSWLFSYVVDYQVWGKSHGLVNWELFFLAGLTHVFIPCARSAFSFHLIKIAM